MTRFEKFKSIKRIEAALDVFRNGVKQTDTSPENKQLFFDILDLAVSEVRRGNTKPMWAVLDGVDRAAKSLTNSGSDLKTSAISNNA